MSDTQGVAPVADPTARFELEGEDNTRLIIERCPLHNGAVLFVDDGIRNATVELEPDDLARVIGALTTVQNEVDGA